MATINPWINFNGNAEEAFTFYKSVFGGEFAKIVRFKDLASAEFKPAEEEENKIKAKITNEIQTAQEAIHVEEEKLLQAAAKIKEGRRNKKIVIENKDQSDIQNSKAQNTLDDQLENKTDISNPLTEEEKREEE